MKDVMLDFETLGSHGSSCITQVALQYFDRHTGELGPYLKLNIDARSHQKLGGTIDANTVYWWLEQSAEARKSLRSDQMDIKKAMKKVNDFISGCTAVWSHSTFDFVILMNTLKLLDIKPSISFRQGLDIRTLISLSGLNVKSMPSLGVQHDALSDALNQISYCVTAFKLIEHFKEKK